MSVVIYEKKEHVAYVTINRPEVLNAFNVELRDAVSDAWLQVRDDSDVWVAVLTGVGRSFSTGADLKELVSTGQNMDPGPSPQAMGVWKPIIAAIDGFAIAGGLNLALQCDIRICTERSVFADTDHRMGRLASVPPLAEMIPSGNALYMILTGTQISAQDAYRWGLVYKVLPDTKSLAEEAQRIAEEIKKAAPLAVQAAKRTYYETRGLPPEYIDRYVKALDPLIMQTEDAWEGPKSFVEKRDPVWQAR